MSSRFGLLLTLSCLCTSAGGSSAQQPPHSVAVTELEIDGASNQLLGFDWIGITMNQSIAITQGGRSTLRFFSADGKPLETIHLAPTGSGGNSSGMLGDTVWVYDASVPQLIFISPQHRIVRKVPTAIAIVLPTGEESPFVPPLGMMSPRPVALVSGGGMLLFAPKLPALKVPAYLHQPPNSFVAIVHVASNGVLENVVTWLVLSNRECSVQTSTVGAGLPFCSQPLYAWSSYGTQIATAEAIVAGADSGTFRVVMLNARGDTVYTRRHPFTARAVTKHEADSALAATTERHRRSANFDFVNAIEAAFHPTIFPPLRSLLIAADGSLWLQQLDTGSTTPWLVLTPQGDVSRIVDVPANLRVRAVRGATIWATRQDGANVSLVRLHIE